MFFHFLFGTARNSKEMGREMGYGRGGVPYICMFVFVYIYIYIYVYVRKAFMYYVTLLCPQVLNSSIVWTVWDRFLALVTFQTFQTLFNRVRSLISTLYFT